MKGPAYHQHVGPDFVGLVPGAKQRDCILWRIKLVRRLKKRISKVGLSKITENQITKVLMKIARSRAF